MASREEEFFTAAAASNEGGTFRAWIPAVSGRLSFSVFGRTSNPSRAKGENVSDGESRYMVIRQARDLSDAMIPMLGRSGEFMFVFAAKTSPCDERPQEYLIGQAFILTKQAWSEIKDEYARYVKVLSRFRTSSDFSVLSKHVGDSFGELLTKMGEKSAFCANAKICRTGTTTIVAVAPHPVGKELPRLPSEPIRRKRMTQLLSAQIFFFVKDIGHNHQHHKQATDTLTDLHPFDSSDDFSWRISTLYNIYRTVIEYKRNPHVSTFSDCLGIIAYAKTFYGICKEELNSDAVKKLPKYYADEVSQSIASIESKIRRSAAEQRHKIDSARNAILALIAIILAYSNILQFSEYKKVVHPDPWTVSVATFMIELPLISSVLCALLVWGYVQVSDKYRPITWGEWVLRLIQPFKRSSAIWLILALAIVCFLVFLMAFMLLLYFFR